MKNANQKSLKNIICSEKFRLYVWAVLILLTAVFIFSNSLPSKLESAEISGKFTEFIKPFLEFFVGEGNVTEHFVRKLAHFTEFFILGFVMALFFKTPTVFPIFLLLVTSLTDETIQIFTERGSSVADVWLDFAGGCCGFTVGILMLSLISTFKKKRQGSDK